MPFCVLYPNKSISEKCCINHQSSYCLSSLIAKSYLGYFGNNSDYSIDCKAKKAEKCIYGCDTNTGFCFENNNQPVNDTQSIKGKIKNISTLLPYCPESKPFSQDKEQYNCVTKEQCQVGTLKNGYLLAVANEYRCGQNNVCCNSVYQIPPSPTPKYPLATAHYSFDTIKKTYTLNIIEYNGNGEENYDFEITPNNSSFSKCDNQITFDQIKENGFLIRSVKIKPRHEGNDLLIEIFDTHTGRNNQIVLSINMGPVSEWSIEGAYLNGTYCVSTN